MVTQVRKKKVSSILRDDNIVTIKSFLKKIPQDKINEEAKIKGAVTVVMSS